MVFLGKICQITKQYHFMLFRATERKSSLLNTLNNFASSVSIPENATNGMVNVKTAEINIQV